MEGCSQEEIAVLSDTIQRNHLLQHITCDMHRESGIHEIRRKTVQQSVSSSKTTATSPYSSRICIMDVMVLPILKRAHPSTIKAMSAKRTEKPMATAIATEEEKSLGQPDAVTSTSEYKVYHTQPFKRKTMFAEKKVRRLIHQFETHPNRESLMADSDKNQKINLFSEKSKGLIRSVGKTEYFEMCEITSEVQCKDCL